MTMSFIPVFLFWSLHECFSTVNYLSCPRIPFLKSWRHCGPQCFLGKPVYQVPQFFSARIGNQLLKELVAWLSDIPNLHPISQTRFNFTFNKVNNTWSRTGILNLKGWALCSITWTNVWNAVSDNPVCSKDLESVWYYHITWEHEGCCSSLLLHQNFLYLSGLTFPWKEKNDQHLYMNGLVNSYLSTEWKPNLKTRHWYLSEMRSQNVNVLLTYFIIIQIHM